MDFPLNPCAKFPHRGRLGLLVFQDSGGVPVSIRREPLHDRAAALLRWYGTAADIENRKQADALRAAEKRTLEMIADGASLKDVLDQLCASIDVQIAPSVTTVLLIDADGKRLWQGGGQRVPQEWISTIIPVRVAFEAGLCGTAAFLKERG